MIDRPTFSLLLGPTPLHPLSRLSEELRVDLWIKRDDLTGFAGGGNKARKLEFLIHDAIEDGATCVVASGAKQSNFVRQTAAACSLAGLRFCGVVMDLPFDEPAGQPEWEPKPQGGNVLLNKLFGAELFVYPDATWDELERKTSEVADMLRKSGEKVYVLPVGGSTPEGALGFVKAAEEIPDGFDWIVTASSSGSTQAGLHYAYAEEPTRVVGIACDPEPHLTEKITDICSGLDSVLGWDRPVHQRDLTFLLDWVGDGYGVPSEAGHRAAKCLARTEGILLDPVYTSKAFAGLLDLIDQRELSGRILFWHTGGIPGIFAHR